MSSSLTLTVHLAEDIGFSYIWLQAGCIRSRKLRIVAKRSFVNSEKTIGRRRAQGYGEGRGAQYLPWIDVHGISSKGLSVRFLGATTGRRHELLSKGEQAVCLDLDWMEAVSDIREQFPLPREDTIQIAHRAGIRHPEADGVAVVVTTDFLVDVTGADGRTRQCAIAVKRTAEIEHRGKGPRVVEKLELERRYWTERSVPWFIVTERECNGQRTKTLSFLYEMRLLNHLDAPHPCYWKERCEAVIRGLAQARGGTVLNLARRLEAGAGWKPGEAIAAIRHLAANRRILIDVERAFDSRGPVSALELPIHPAHASMEA